MELRKNHMFHGQHVSLACVSSAQWEDMVTAFTLEHPHFTLSCTHYKRSEIVNNGLPAQHNFLLTCEAGVPDFVAAEMDSTILFEDTLMIAVAQSHPFADKKTVNLKDVLSETLLRRSHYAIRQCVSPCNGIKNCKKGLGNSVYYPVCHAISVVGPKVYSHKQSSPSLDLPAILAKNTASDKGRGNLQTICSDIL